jgi:hypothetical protein
MKRSEISDRGMRIIVEYFAYPFAFVYGKLTPFVINVRTDLEMKKEIVKDRN